MTTRKFASLVFMVFFSALAARCQGQDSAANPQQAPSARGQMRQGRGDGQPPLTGKITSIKNGALELSTADGANIIVTLSDKTEFRKDRRPAKLADFKVGDMVFVRGEQNADHTVTAAIVAERTGGGGPDGAGGGRGFGGGTPALGELGKDYVAGEIKTVDAPKITVLRTDNVTQTIELTEESSLRKGRDSITMAEIQPGDHVIARGSMQNNVFTPRNVMILSAEQWQRMQEFAGRRRGIGESAPGNAAPNTPPNAPAPAPPQQ